MSRTRDPQPQYGRDDRVGDSATLPEGHRRSYRVLGGRRHTLDSRFCRSRNRFEERYQLAKRGLTISQPLAAPFVELWIYECGLLDELAVNGYWARPHQDCPEAGEILLTSGKCPWVSRNGSPRMPPSQGRRFNVLTTGAIGPTVSQNVQTSQKKNIMVPIPQVRHRRPRQGRPMVRNPMTKMTTGQPKPSETGAPPSNLNPPHRLKVKASVT